MPYPGSPQWATPSDLDTEVDSTVVDAERGKADLLAISWAKRGRDLKPLELSH